MAALALAALAAMPRDARAGGVNLVQNGNFLTTSMSAPSQMNTTNVSNWSTTGYNFILQGASATTTGSQSVNYGALTLASYDNSASNGLPASVGTQFVGADGAFMTGAITQTLTGLTVGDHINLSFYWAGAQQSGYNQATTESWQVSLGSQTYATNPVSNAARGFTGWMAQSFTFTATSSSETLSFLSAGTPSGEPPFSLLDGVTAYDVPEPGSAALMATGIMAIAAAPLLSRRRRGRAAGQDGLAAE